MLDTNTIAYAKNRKPVQVLQHLLSHDPYEISISSITMAELEYGICHSSKPERNRVALMMFLAGIKVIPFDVKAAMEYGDIRQRLQAKGLLIGGNDMLIAAHARSLGLTLVTHNTREFSRVEGLTIEDWAE
jgi:tRNA(fMet)-specific endonuclease VapC